MFVATTVYAVRKVLFYFYNGLYWLYAAIAATFCKYTLVVLAHNGVLNRSNRKFAVGVAILAKSILLGISIDSLHYIANMSMQYN